MFIAVSALTVELRSWNRDHLTCKASIKNNLALYRKRLQTPDLEELSRESAACTKRGQNSFSITAVGGHIKQYLGLDEGSLIWDARASHCAFTQSTFHFIHK